MTATSPAYAKINISLDIISKRTDGYHNLLMVMQTVSLADEITIECSKRAKSTKEKAVSINTELPYLPRDERNIAAKAALAYFEHTNIKEYNASITIKKNIPVCAGLGGGSADGACVLRLLDRMFKTELGRETLEKLGSAIGSDVPFCIDGGTKLAEGRGEELTDLPQIPLSYIVICKPPFIYSTPELYGRVNCEKISARPDTKGLIKALEVSDIGGVARRMYNVFEDVLTHGKHDVSEIKSKLLDNNALGAVMSGSGPAVFGIFDREANARKAYEQLKEEYKECYLTETIK